MVSHYFEAHRGGIEIVAGRLARELAGLGLAVTWAATGDDPPSEAGLETLPLSAWNGTERRLGIPFPFPSTGAVRRLAAACRSADMILVHDALYPTSVIARLAGRRLGKPVMIVQHIGKVDYRNPLLRGLMRAANRLVALPMLRSADRRIFISETTRAFFELRGEAAAETIFNGVDTALFRPARDDAERDQDRAALGLPPGAPAALFVGRFVEKKGLHWLRRLAERHPEMTWLLAGWGPIDPESWKLPNVRLFGGVSGESLARLYRAADLFVLPSVGEGFPLVIQEALAAGLPVICGEETARADPSAAPWLDGVALDATNPDATVDALSAAVVRALNRPDERTARRAFAAEHYSWPAAAKRYYALIREMLAKAPA
jgi:glycosyltransferase involved in cell wall biosynthesis